MDYAFIQRETQKMKAAIDQLPELRSYKIEQFRKAIKDGSYIIDPVKIAEKILKEL